MQHDGETKVLVTEPFEPLELSSLKALSALLLALTSAKRVSELTALSESSVQEAPGRMALRVHCTCLRTGGESPLVRRRGILLYVEMRTHSGRPATGPATFIEVSVDECLHDMIKG